MVACSYLHRQQQSCQFEEKTLVNGVFAITTLMDSYLSHATPLVADVYLPPSRLLKLIFMFVLV